MPGVIITTLLRRWENVVRINLAIPHVVVTLTLIKNSNLDLHTHHEGTEMKRHVMSHELTMCDF